MVLTCMRFSHPQMIWNAQQYPRERERERKECTKSGLGGIVAVYDIYHDDSSATSGTH